MFSLKKGEFKWKSSGLRIWNEVATLCLVAIVFLVELKDSLDWIKGVIGFFLIAAALIMAIYIYKRLRTK
jgi:putative membrane protein